MQRCLKRNTIAGFLMTLASGPAAAAFTGNDLLGFCQSADPFSQGACVGLISGTINSYLQGSQITGRSLLMSIARNAGQPPAQAEDTANTTMLKPEIFILFNGYCPQDGMKQGQVTEAVVKYLRANPEQRARPAELLVMEAMDSAFPILGCNWKPNSKPTP